MRQIGDEYRIDPHEVDGSGEIQYAQMTPALAKGHQAWTRNTYAERAHKYCSGTLNFNNGSFSDEETNRFQTCLKKYATSFQLFTQEKQLFDKNNAEMDRLQQNKYAQFEQL